MYGSAEKRKGEIDVEFIVIIVVVVVVAIIYQFIANTKRGNQYDRAMKKAMEAIRATGFSNEKMYDSWEGIRMLFDHSSQRIAIIYGNQFEEFMDEIPYDIYGYQVISSCDTSTSHSEKETFHHVKIMLKDFENSFVVMTFNHIGIATDLSAKLEIAIKSAPQKVEVVNQPAAPAPPPPASPPTPLYDVILIHPGAERARVVASIVEFLGCEISFAGQMVEHAPAFVANGLNLQRATELRNILQGKGAKVEVQQTAK
jgi:ribosomal protein L7/L12